MAQKKEEISNREKEEKEKKDKEALLEKQKKEKASQHLRQQRIKVQFEFYFFINPISSFIFERNYPKTRMNHKNYRFKMKLKIALMLNPLFKN